MSKITESTIELLETHGYQYIYAPDIAPDMSVRERTQTCDMPAGKY